MIDVHTYKYGRIPHYFYQVELVERTADLWIVRGQYGRKVQHYSKGITFEVKNRSIEFFWPGRPYTVGADITNGKIDSYYCNIILPPTMTGDVVEWVDLDLDLIVKPDLTYQLIDQEDLEVNSVKYGYPPDVISGAWRAADELIALVKERQYPFDGGALR
ncbi:MAG TPA: DUF402 domain-containing protein [Symbiobacteriaceae bacterium]|jgi:uncharacterized protein|nr:DUF402 domain-containing protein [Symbiobacteriaceae bacterium]